MNATPPCPHATPEWAEYPSCTKCNAPLVLNEGCEWPDDPRLRLCSSCMSCALEELLNTAPRPTTDSVEALEKACGQAWLKYDIYTNRSKFTAFINGFKAGYDHALPPLSGKTDILPQSSKAASESESGNSTVPTVAPHLAGLVERLEKIYDAAAERGAENYSEFQAIKESIAALTQLAPLAGEVEMLRASIAAVEAGRDAKTEAGGPLITFRQSAVEDMNKFADAMEGGPEIRALKEKLAASEREVEEYKNGFRAIKTANVLLSKANKEGTAELLSLYSQLAAAKLDADALAGCLQEIVDGVCDPKTAVRRALVTLAPIKQALAAHRATGGAGEKK